MARDEKITYFAKTDARGKHVPFGIKDSDRSKHTYVIGKSGMGKSTMLENMAIQDIHNGEGITFIDPHGSTAEKLLEYIPEERVDDVLYLAPFDLGYPISFNVLENVHPDRRHLVVNGLMSAFAKIWVDAWSARMEYILQNTLLALLEYPEATLLDVNYMYTHKNFRKKVLSHVTDPTVKSFWEKEFVAYGDKYVQEATPAIQNKVGQFASSALVRNMIGQPQSSFDIRELMDTKKIFIVNLSKGRVGEGNANLLGSMLITKLYLAAMSRADAAPTEMAKLPNHYLYVDEFQSFANRSFADILSEARKYKLSLTIAHQYIEQMEEEVRAAVFGNVGTMITFRVGAYDAEVLEKEFAPTFTIEDIVNLGARQIYLKLMIDNVSSQPFSATTLPPIDPPEVCYQEIVVAHSRRMYSRPRDEVESEIAENIAARDANEGGNTPKKSAQKKTQRAPRDKMLELVKSRDEEAKGSDKREEKKEAKPREEKNDTSRDELRNMLQAVAKREVEKEKKEEQKKPEPSSTHRDDLKQALAAISQKKNTQPREHSNENEVKQESDESRNKRSRNRNRNNRKKKQQDEQVSEQQQSSSGPRQQKPSEIPEDTLRRLLDVSEEVRKKEASR